MVEIMNLNLGWKNIVQPHLAIWLLTRICWRHVSLILCNYNLIVKFIFYRKFLYVKFIFYLLFFAFTVRKYVDSERIPHLLLYGPPGTGKTSTALAIARQLYGHNMNTMVLEVPFFYFPLGLTIFSVYNFMTRIIFYSNIFYFIIL